MTDTPQAIAAVSLGTHAQHEVECALRNLPQPVADLPIDLVRELMVLAFIRGASYEKERTRR